MIPNAENNVAVIEDVDDLAAIVERLRRSPWVALDTEFMRERTYYPKLCLIQVDDGERSACIDPLALDDLRPLESLLTDTSVTKVLHAAFQDIEVLLATTGTVPRPVFDTQAAAALLGHPDQIGYARLVEAMLGVRLDKAHTRSDWSKRPLAREELEYAADDVRYLAQLYPRMRAQLDERGRLDWLEPEFAALEETERYRVDPASAWRRVRGLSRLRPAQQQALALLADWRERTAIETDRPRKWILKDDVLLEMARKRPRDHAALRTIRNLPAGVARRHGDELVALCERARSLPAEPLAAGSKRPDPEQEPLVDALMAALRARAAEVEISPGALATRRELERMVAGEDDLPILTGWRRRAAGEVLLEVLNGQRGLTVDNGRLRIENG